MSRLSNQTNTIPINNWAICYVILIVISTFSLLYGWIPVLHSFAYIAVIAILLSLMIVPRFFLTLPFFLILIYSIVVWYNAKWGDPYTFDKKIMDGVMLCMSSSISYYLLKSNDQRIKKYICIFVSVILIIQSITSQILYISSNDTIRSYMAMTSIDDININWDYLYKMGVLSFDMLHSIPILIPPLIMWIRMKGESKRWKYLCLSTLISIVLISFIYDITTVQILAVFSLVASFLISQNYKKQNSTGVIILSLLLIPIALSPSLQNSILSTIEDVAEGTLKTKIADARYNLTHDIATGDIANRQDLYTTSFETFLESPLLGKNTEKGIGGHSAIFDRLGAFGLVGFLPFILILFTTTQSCKSHMSNLTKRYFLISTIVFVVLLISKNMCRLEEWLVYLVIVPAMLTMKKEAME